mmetsp:Transcript_33363/g.92087  ORF Transcript_33363/g.92087 Transcript_33363/m.92087 type:complete len:1614 (+) Transcript_33363:149-4990(+)
MASTCQVPAAVDGDGDAEGPPAAKRPRRLDSGASPQRLACDGDAPSVGPEAPDRCDGNAAMEAEVASSGRLPTADSNVPEAAVSQCPNVVPSLPYDLAIQGMEEQPESACKEVQDHQDVHKAFAGNILTQEDETDDAEHASLPLSLSMYGSPQPRRQAQRRLPPQRRLQQQRQHREGLGDSADEVEPITSTVLVVGPAVHASSTWSKDRLPPPREHEVEFLVKDPGSYRQGKSVLSSIVALQGGAFRFRLLVFPMGTESTQKPEQLAAFVEVVPPEGNQDVRWAFEGVKYQISVVNWKDYRRSTTQTDTYTFRWDSTDRGWHRGFLKAVDMNMESGWLSESGELCLRGSCSARRAMLHVPTNGGLTSSSRRSVGYTGLKNHGATCYMNCLLQTLFHIGRFREIVYSIDGPDQAATELQPGQVTAVSEDDVAEIGSGGVALADEKPALPLLIALQNLFYRLQTSEVPVSCRELMRSFGWDTADAFMQHDAHELNRLLCDRLEEQMKGTAMDSAIKRLFEGEMENYIDCMDIEYRSTRSETFYDLQLNVKNDAGKDLTSLEESLRDFTSEETLEGDNAYDAGAHGKQRARKGIRFKRFPPVLYIQLKRFMFDAERMDMCKVNSRLEFPLTLDMEAMAPGSGKYVLHTVVVHSGGVSSGHYYAFVRVRGVDRSRDGENGRSRWVKFDDEQVTPCSEQAAVEDNYGGEDPMIWNYFQLSPRQLADRTIPTTQRIHNAYMLSYVREDLLDDVLAPPNLDDGREPYQRMAQRCEREARFAEERRRARVEQLMRVEVRMLLERDLRRMEGFWSHHSLPCAYRLRMSRDQLGEDVWLEAEALVDVPHAHMALFLLHIRKTRQTRFKFLPPNQALRTHLPPQGAPHNSSCDPPHLVVLCVVSRGYDPQSLEWRALSNAADLPHEILRWSDDICLLIVKYFCPTMQRLVTLGCCYCHNQETLECMVTTDGWLEQRLKPFVDRNEVAPLPADAYRDGALREGALMCWEEYCYKNPKEDIMERNVQNTIEKEGLFNGDIVIWQPVPRPAALPPRAMLAVAAEDAAVSLDGGDGIADCEIGPNLGTSAGLATALEDAGDCDVGPGVGGGVEDAALAEVADLPALTVRDLAVRLMSQVPVLVRLHAADGPLCPEGVPADGVWGQALPGAPGAPEDFGEALGQSIPGVIGLNDSIAEGDIASRELTADTRWRVSTFANCVAKAFDVEDAVRNGQALWLFDHGAPTMADEPPVFRLDEAALARRRGEGGGRATDGSGARCRTLAELLPRSIAAAQHRLVFHAALLPVPLPGPSRRRPVAVHFFTSSVVEVGACIFQVSGVEAGDVAPTCEDSDSGFEASVATGRPPVDASEILELARRHLELPQNAELRAKLAPPVGHRAATSTDAFPMRVVDVVRGRIRAVHRSRDLQSGAVVTESTVGGGGGTPTHNGEARPTRVEDSIASDPIARPSWLWPSRGENFFAAGLRVEPDWDSDADLGAFPESAADEKAMMAEVFHAEQSGHAFGHPFLLPVSFGERAASVALRVQAKLGVPDEELRQWRMLIVWGDVRSVLEEAEEWPFKSGSEGAQATWTPSTPSFCLERPHPAQRARSPLATRALRPHKPLTIRAR